MVLLGKEIFLKFGGISEISKAVIAFIATFYLLDLDYPTSSLLPLSVLQSLVFLDNCVHPDCQADVAKALRNLEQFNES